MKDCNQAKMDNMAFRYSDQKDAKFLLGAYRGCNLNCVKACS